jgi:hypothetical protein
VPRHSQDRPHQEKGGRAATERDEFLRAAWRVTVAAVVEPERLVFVDECGTHTSLAPIYGYAPKGERLRLRACYELGRKSHRNADSKVGLVPSRSTFPAFLSRF